jgi:hypothetical protein
MSENTKANDNPERELSQIEKYVLDMGNRFSDAIRLDQTYAGLQDRVTTLDYNIAQLGRYPSEEATVATLEQERDEHGAQLQDRKLLLVDLWEESHGDEGAFTRLIRVEDIRNALEADPEQTELLDQYRQARADLDAYRYQSGGLYPSPD